MGVFYFKIVVNGNFITIAKHRVRNNLTIGCNFVS